MSLTAETFLNPYVLLYLLIVVIGQLAFARWLKFKSKKVSTRRTAQGLPPDILMDHSERLADRKREAVTQSVLLVVTVVATPFLLLGVASTQEVKNGLAVVFVGLLLWVLISGTDVARAFLGGLAFKTLAAFKAPFQVGDRVNIKGFEGKVMAFDPRS